jgi:glucosamine-6-phosphate deaminase
MKVFIFNNQEDTGRAAGAYAAAQIKKTIREKGIAHIVMATGTSQFEIIKELVEDKSIAWDKVIMFHLDEYIGIPDTHNASFAKYLKERFLEKVPALRAVHLIDGKADPHKESKRIGAIISSHPIDIALVGIGENGHVAFNDPPADFDTETPYIIVSLDPICRKQQWKEGWFNHPEEVPGTAISMSIRQIMKSKAIICSVVEQRKAAAVRNCLQNEPDPLYPASILQKHPDCSVYLDKEAASFVIDSPLIIRQ